MIRFLSVVLAMLMAQAGEVNPPGVLLWHKGVPAGDIAAKETFANHSLAISHRDKAGEAEAHAKDADVILIQKGTATLVVGGEIVGPRATATDEIRGTSLRGGVMRMIGPGDVLHIPAGTPHQFLLKPGEEITYVLVKITSP